MNHSGFCYNFVGYQNQLKKDGFFKDHIYKTKMIKMIFDNVFADIIQLVNNLG